MIVRKAEKKDVEQIAILLKQVADIHSDGRPDIFKEKSVDEAIEDTINDLKKEERNIIVVEDDNLIKGVAIYKFRIIENNIHKKDSKIISVEELVVDEKYRGNSIGKVLLDKIKEIGKKEKCNSMELNCWSFNEKALGFYEKYGMQEQRIFFEMKLKEE